MNDLTIIIPTTGRDTLPAAVASAEFADDVYVVADRSPDTIADLHVEMGGAGLARNAGLLFCDTTWVGFVDDDDQLIGDAYMAAIEPHPAVDMVIHTAWHPQVGTIPRPGWPLEHGNVTVAITAKTEVLRELGGFIAGPPRTFKGEDYELVRRFIDHEKIVVMSPIVSYLIRPQEGSYPWLSKTATSH